MKIYGIKKLCSATKDLAPKGYAPRYEIQVHLDVKTGKLYWASVCGNGYIQYNDPDMIYVCNIRHPTTMAGIRAMINNDQRVRYAVDHAANP